MSEGKLTPDTMMSASRLPGLLGLSGYSSPNDELRLSIDAIDGKEPPPFNVEAADWGNRFEMPILEQSVIRLGLEKYNLVHQEAQFHDQISLCCSLDGTADGSGHTFTTDPERGIFVVGDDSITLDGWGVIEAKLTSQDAEDVPPLWRGPVQLQGQMMVTGAKWGAVCTLYRGTKLRIFLFKPHEVTQKAIERAVIDFQGRLDFYKEHGSIDWYPPISSADATKLYPTGDNDELIHLSDNAQELCALILDAKQNIKDIEEKINFWETSLKDMLKDHTKGVAGSYRLTWPMRHYKAQPERVVPAKEASVIRQSTITIKETK